MEASPEEEKVLEPKSVSIDYQTMREGIKALAASLDAGREVSDNSQRPGAALVHAHGGGMVGGSVLDSSAQYATRVLEVGVPMLSVEYRLAPEHLSETALVEDCYTGLVWLHEHAHELKIDRNRIGVTGESAGGGIMAGVALMARDRDLSPPLAKQILAYPMLDDRKRVENDEYLDPSQLKDHAALMIAWAALLGKERVGRDGVSEYVAPARAKSLKGLPSTFIYVGCLDIFAAENAEYVLRLVEAKVETEFYLYPGASHAFEEFGVGTQSSAAKHALTARNSAMRSF